ncbi:hypothetical protein BAN20980_01864 [Burkholderia anthina]|uniref:Uncharacterized protein n=1 Tax=Burkholderia anthina TaxID=179879 RepID=A0A6P2G6G4_9BURK|nr:hypothetical protein BAN20980_01864 [Burkholderia anthina]
MDVLSIAQHCGMQLTLDARIGREECRSAHGSVEALERFAEALVASLGCGESGRAGLAERGAPHTRRA